MDELISRDSVVEAIQKIKGVGGVYLFDPDDVYAAIETVPAVDAVPVVRCKDCKRSRGWGKETLLCYRDETTIHIVKPDAYCDGSQRRYAADAPEVLEVEPVRYGRWEYRNGTHSVRYCSECNDRRRTYTLDNYCPHCGAKMDLKENPDD